MSEHEELRKINERVRVAVYMDDAAREYRRLRKRKWAQRQLLLALAATLGVLLLLAGLFVLRMMHIYLVAALALVVITGCGSRIGYLWHWLGKR